DPGTLPALADLSIPPSSVTLPSLASGGVMGSAITWKLVSDSGTPAVSGYASPSEVTFSAQNGAGAGTLNSIAIEEDGTITASFTNGKTVDFARLALAEFNNLDGLASIGAG